MLTCFYDLALAAAAGHLAAAALRLAVIATVALPLAAMTATRRLAVTRTAGIPGAARRLAAATKCRLMCSCYGVCIIDVYLVGVGASIQLGGKQ